MRKAQGGMISPNRLPPNETAFCFHGGRQECRPYKATIRFGSTVGHAFLRAGFASLCKESRRGFQCERRNDFAESVDMVYEENHMSLPLRGRWIAARRDGGSYSNGIFSWKLPHGGSLKNLLHQRYETVSVRSLRLK